MSLKGKRQSPEHTNKIRLALRGKYCDEKSSAWKGDSVKRTALHAWVEKHLGKPKICWDCNRTDSKIYHWANISREYKRSNGLKDWKRLCPKCHIIFDFDNHARGEKHGFAKFKEKQIIKIRNLWESGKYMQKDIAKMFGMHRTHVSCIVLRKAWKHI